MQLKAFERYIPLTGPLGMKHRPSLWLVMVTMKGKSPFLFTPIIKMGLQGQFFSLWTVESESTV